VIRFDRCKWKTAANHEEHSVMNGVQIYLQDCFLMHLHQSPHSARPGVRKSA